MEEKRYLAEYTDTEIIRINNVTGAAFGTPNKAICDDRNSVEQALLNKGFTQAEINEKMPVEETDE